APEGSHQLRVEFVHRNCCQETESSQIYWKQRDLPPANRAGSGEQSAIAAQHDHQVAAFRDLAPRDAACAWRVACSLFVVPRSQAVRAKPFEQLGNNLPRGRHSGLRDNSYGSNVGHTAGILDSLRRLKWGFPSEPF